jgi:hypothetical protein
MSTLWEKHLYHIVEPRKPPWVDTPEKKEKSWHIVVHGQKSIAVGVTMEFPCWGHRAEILSLIDDAEIDRFSFAILSQDVSDEWSLVFTVGPPPALRCSLWAPLIDERDVHVLDWITGEVKLAIWKDMEVVLKVGTSPDIDDNLEISHQSEAYRFLQDTDLTPKFLGHLVRDGVVIGFVLEALTGRSPGLSSEDREACMAAALRLHAAGTFHSDFNSDNIIITANGARFVDVHLMLPTYEGFVVHEVNRLFDEEIASLPRIEKKPPRPWEDGKTPDWEEERAMDIKELGTLPALPPVRKSYAFENNPWSTAPPIPYLPGKYRPWDLSEVGWPSTIGGTARGPSCFSYHQFLSPEYLSLPLHVVPPGTLPGSHNQFQNQFPNPHR